jgi:hypothetical protein
MEQARGVVDEIRHDASSQVELTKVSVGDKQLGVSRRYDPKIFVLSHPLSDHVQIEPVAYRAGWGVKGSEI